jgi:hypothetical protein
VALAGATVAAVVAAMTTMTSALLRKVVIT